MRPALQREEPGSIHGGRAQDVLDGFTAFTAAVRARLEQGRAVYRNQSFDRDPAELLEELAQEALDLAGWGFVLWHRTQALAAELTGKLGVPRDG